MGLCIEHNSTYILEGHSFSFFPVALNSSDLISTSLPGPFLNQGKKENTFHSERTLAKTCSNRVLDFFEFNRSYFSESGLKIHDFFQFIDEFYRTMSQINASPLDLINDLKKIDTGMRRFKYSKLNKETNGWLIVVIKAIYREAIIRQIKNLDTFESSLNVLDELLKNLSAFYGNDLYFFNSYAP